ncbi:hypothetical protein [Rheinheimera faecalis]|uniref:hypothetical protein n=1 Tax=Rheinheimera faecalis TaxID=2901141 RepID=UPI001E442827|nr:hypothetical protein [Rheinheimera faecalis]
MKQNPASTQPDIERMRGLGGVVYIDEAADFGIASNTADEELAPQPLVAELADSQYENELLQQIASESPTFTKLVRDSLQYLDELTDNHIPTWLGSFTDGRPKTQVQLVVTQSSDFTIDED